MQKRTTRFGTTQSKDGKCENSPNVEMKGRVCSSSFVCFNCKNGYEQ